MPTRRSFFKWLSVLFSGGLFRGSRSEAAVLPAQAATVVAAAPAGAQVAAPNPHSDDEPISRTYDLVIVGGGIAGVSAAISAARHGVKVALLHNRSMLGGNSSSEVKLYPENNSAKQPWMKDSGIFDEFHVEDRARNHREYKEGTMNCQWDLVLYEWVLREKNIDLYLNTHMHKAILQNAAHIKAVFCFQIGTEKTFEFHAPLFVDATGDGYLGYRAGADFRWGREGKEEFGEAEAPNEPDDKVMGSTLFFTALDAGRPVPFQPPPWAAEFPTEADLKRSHSYIKGGYWWIEIGAPYHPIRDNNEIVHEGLRQVMGVWDHIKNRGDHGAANYGMDFVGFWPYKREGRRLMGDVILTQQDLQNPRLRDDDVAYGCWYIDIHSQGGILNAKAPPYEPPVTDENWDRFYALPYGIPLRALYSRNVENLLMAGRPISASYVAFSSSRVLCTGSTVGLAVGAAASLCKKYATTPRIVARDHSAECRQIILRDDGHIPGVANEDGHDLARTAVVTASSQWKLEFPAANFEARPLNLPLGQIIPVAGDRIDTVELLLDSKLDRPQMLEIGLRPAAHVWDFRATEDIAVAQAMVPARQEGVWVSFPLNAKVDPQRLYYVYTRTILPEVSWQTYQHVRGTPFGVPVGVAPADRPRRTWRRLLNGKCHLLRITPKSECFGPMNVVRGASRPDAWTNLWQSDPARQLPAWLELRWPQPIEFNSVQLTFDTNTHVREEFPLFRYPDCVRDYELAIPAAAGWKSLASITGNYHRRRVHRIPAVKTDRLRINIQATNGAPQARVFEVRVYHDV